MSLRKFKPDQRKREEGILVEVETKGDYPVARVVDKVGLLPTFQLANATDQNPNFDRSYEAKLRPWRDAKAKGDKTESELSQMFLDGYRDAFCETVVRAWYNVDKEYGECSASAAKALMADIPEVFDCLAAVAQDRRNFRVDLPGSVEADAGNS